MEVKALASSSAGNAYYVTDGDAALLLDAGLPLREIKQGTGYRVSSLDGVLITHEHGDHSKAVPDLIKAAVDVYMSAGTAEALGVSGHRVHIIKALEQFKVGEWMVMPFDTIHDCKEPLGFVVKGPHDGKLLYLTDSAYCKYRFKGLTTLMVECNHSADIIKANVLSGVIPAAHAKRVTQTHMSLDRLLEFLRVNDLSRVREVFLLHLSGDNSNEAEFKLAVQRATGKPVYVAEERSV